MMGKCLPPREGWAKKGKWKKVYTACQGSVPKEKKRNSMIPIKPGTPKRNRERNKQKWGMVKNPGNIILSPD